jgi:hypothetical protein
MNSMLLRELCHHKTYVLICEMVMYPLHKVLIFIKLHT